MTIQISRKLPDETILLIKGESVTEFDLDASELGLDPAELHALFFNLIPDGPAIATAMHNLTPILAPPGTSAAVPDPSGKIFLTSKFDDNSRIKANGGKFDKDSKRWFVMGSVPPALADLAY